jgi:hypothetical protein
MVHCLIKGGAPSGAGAALDLILILQSDFLPSKYEPE